MSASPVHGTYCYEKEYKVLVARQPDQKQLTAWRTGVVLEDGYRTQPIQVSVAGTYGKGAWLKVILKEGRKRQIREMGKLMGLPVARNPPGADWQFMAREIETWAMATSDSRRGQ